IEHSDAFADKTAFHLLSRPRADGCERQFNLVLAVGPRGAGRRLTERNSYNAREPTDNSPEHEFPFCRSRRWATNQWTHESPLTHRGRPTFTVKICGLRMRQACRAPPGTAKSRSKD